MKNANGVPPIVSIAIPCRNEARYIGDCLTSILASDYPLTRLEILVADGDSDDGTQDILSTYAAAHSCITVLANHRRTTPAALNLAIRSASGSIVIRMDAHVLYPPDYVRQLVTALEETGADNVGGVLETVPADDTPTARAIALGLSHWFGVGNSYFRTGTSERREVDTVPFGCYRRETLDRIGHFDEELVRNQDDELNFRLLARGGRIVLLPEIRCRYFARRSLGQVARMYYQYGYFKPLVARKVGTIVTLRQLIPSTLIAALIGCSTFALWVPQAAAVLAIIVALYTGAVLALAGAAMGRDFRCGIALAAVFPTLHFSYGFGFIRGVYDHLIMRRRRKVHDVSFSR